MITQIYAPNKDLPYLVQINHPNGTIGFYVAKTYNIATSSFLGKIVAIFKPKHLSSYTPAPKEPL